MTTHCCPIALALLAVLAVAGTAGAADAPPLVAIEVAPGVDVDPTDVRQVIAAELGAPVVGAHEAPAASDLLLVAIDRHAVRMSLRTDTVPVVSRTIAVPADRAGRLRAIGWLAGNLMRDQVGPIVAALPPPAPIGESPAPTEPPPKVEDVSPSSLPAAVVASRPSSSPKAIPHARWSITAGGGPVLNFVAPETSFYRGGAAYLVELRHQASAESLLFGAALHAGPGGLQQHYFGAAGFVGSVRRRGPLSIEGNAGLGVEALKSTRTATVLSNGSSETRVVVYEPAPHVFARLGIVGGLRITRDFDLVVQLAAHLSSVWQTGSFLSSTGGVRFRLP
jgi:hypothetical protein